VPSARATPSWRRYRRRVPQLLLIEDDDRIRSALIRALTDRGHVVSSAPNGLTGLQAVVDEPPELVVLDLGLPDIDGGQLLRMIRSVSKVPVIVATARDDDAVIVSVLDAGADDYVVKPFSADTLDARIRAVLRRSTTAPDAAPHVVGELVVDPRTRVATLAGRDLELRPREFDLLAFLAARPGEVVPKRTLMAEVWQMPYGGADKTVDVHLSWLRNKLGESANAPRMLHTVRGVGVKLVEPAE
jgi:two-component system KDP operon response regulator KdpE